MLSVASIIEKQSLIAERNNLELAQMRNSSMLRGMYSPQNFNGNLDVLTAQETAIGMNSVCNEAQLMAINAELNSLNESGSKLNYMA